MKLSRKNIWSVTRDYFMIVFGIMLYAFGFSAFIFPEKIVIGGMAGFGTVVYFVTERFAGYGIPVAVTSYAMNLVLPGICQPHGRQALCVAHHLRSHRAVDRHRCAHSCFP